MIGLSRHQLDDNWSLGAMHPDSEAIPMRRRGEMVRSLDDMEMEVSHTIRSLYSDQGQVIGIANQLQEAHTLLSNLSLHVKRVQSDILDSEGDEEAKEYIKYNRIKVKKLNQTDVLNLLTQQTRKWLWKDILGLPERMISLLNLQLARIALALAVNSHELKSCFMNCERANGQMHMWSDPDVSDDDFFETESSDNFSDNSSLSPTISSASLSRSSSSSSNGRPWPLFGGRVSLPSFSSTSSSSSSPVAGPRRPREGDVSPVFSPSVPQRPRLLSDSDSDDVAEYEAHDASRFSRRIQIRIRNPADDSHFPGFGLQQSDLHASTNSETD